MPKIAAVICNGDDNAYRFAIPEELIGAGFSVDLKFTRAPALPVTPLDYITMELSSIEAALDAQEQGYDAVFVNTIGDYALPAQRSGVDIPVVGAGQSAMLVAASLGHRFSIVSIWPQKMRFIYENLLRDYGLSDLCASIRHVTDDSELATLANEENFVTDMSTQKLESIQRIVGECRGAVSEDGGEVVILGCTCMSPTHAEVQAAMDVPVINGVTAGYKFTEMILSLGLFSSREAYPRVEGERHAVLRNMVDVLSGGEAKQGLSGFQPTGLPD